MKAVKVQYTVQPEYAEQNKRNVEKVMAHLRQNPIEGMQYSTFTDQDDPNTFIHINFAKDAETLSKLSEVAAFNEFRMALKASGPVSPPKQTTLNLVDMAFDL
jgi:quinol monooxygenase YgiN